MKNLIFIGILIFSSVATGQENEGPTCKGPVRTNDSIPRDKSYIYEVVDAPAEFPGGRDALVTYLTENIKIPPSPNGKKKYYGKTYVKFVVSDQGEISNVKIQRGAIDCPQCDDAALNAVRNMPDWIPGLYKGESVNQWFTLPIIFSIK